MNPTNRTILDAAVVVYAQNYGTFERPLRPLVSEDFDRIRAIRTQLQSEWRTAKESEPDYNDWRRRRLAELKRTNRWHDTTVNLYASILSTLITWSRNGLSSKHKCILKETRAGVKLWSQFLDGCGKLE